MVHAAGHRALAVIKPVVRLLLPLPESIAATSAVFAADPAVAYPKQGIPRPSHGPFLLPHLQVQSAHARAVMRSAPDCTTNGTCEHAARCSSTSRSSDPRSACVLHSAKHIFGVRLHSGLRSRPAARHELRCHRLAVSESFFIQSNHARGTGAAPDLRSSGAARGASTRGRRRRTEARVRL